MDWFTADGNLVNGQALYNLAGWIPSFLVADNKDNAQTQFNQNYSHGGGWSPFSDKWVLHDDDSIEYPGDPTYKPLAYTYLHNQKVVVYPHAWVAIINPDKSFEVARMD